MSTTNEDEPPDLLFSPDALPAEVFGAFSGATEVVVEHVTPNKVCITQTFAAEDSTLLWSSAVVLAQRWASSDDALPAIGCGSRVLELGAGLGLNAIGLAAMGAAVTATEIEPALTALRKSVERNHACWEATGSIKSVELYWGEETLSLQGGPFDAVICADCIYSRPLRPLLLKTLRQVCTEGTAIVFASETRGDEEAFVSEVACTLGLHADRIFGPDDRTVQIHVLSPLAKDAVQDEPLRLLDLPDELFLEVARSLLAGNAVQGMLRLAGASRTAHVRLAAAQREAELRRLRWAAELSRYSRPSCPEAQLAVQEIHCSNDGRQAVALASNTAIAGPELVARTGRITWTIKVDRCIRNVIRIGVCHAWPTEAAQCWGFYPQDGYVHQMVWDETGRLDYGHGVLPVVACTGKVRAGMDSAERELVSVQCVLDRDAGALYISIVDADTAPDRVPAPTTCLTTLDTPPILWAIPPGVALRPWVYLSNHGDAVTFDDVFYRVQ